MRFLKVRHTYYLVIMLFFCNNNFAQAVNFGNFYIPGGGSVYLNSSFTNSPGIGQGFDNNGDFTLTGNFSNDETGMVVGNGTIHFSGTSLQQITGTSSPVFFNAELNNTNNLQQTLDVTINGSFDLTNGVWHLNNQTLKLEGSIDNTGNTGTISGSINSNIIIGGTIGGNIGTLLFTSGNNQLGNLTINRNGSGASATLGTDLDVEGFFTFTSGNFLIGSNTLTLAGNLSGLGGSFTGSAASNLIITGSGNNLGTLNFTTGSQTLNSLSMQRTGVGANAAVVLGTPLTVNALDLQNGILATGNNLFTWTRTGSLTPAAQTSFTANSTAYKNSYICLCTGSGNALSFTSPFDASDNIGFRVNNAGPNVWLPIGVDFEAPNRVRLNNSGTTDNFTFLLAKGDIGGTDKPVVRRIWYAYETTTGGSVADLSLFFTKQDPAQFGISQDEIETGFDYTDITFTQKNYGDNNYIDVAQGADIVTATSNTNGTELFGQYRIGISPDVNSNTDGINQFSRFAVMNIGSFILPLEWLNFTARSNQQKADLNWAVTEEKNVSSYIVERSTDGIRFFSIGSVQAYNNNKLQNSYQYTDVRPGLSKNYYRIKVLDGDASVTYSKTVILQFGQAYKIAVVPNPVTNGHFILTMNDLPLGTYQLNLVNSSGVSAFKKQIIYTDFTGYCSIEIPTQLANGWYLLQIRKQNLHYEIPIIIEH